MIGHLVSNYKIMEKIGEGGMGDVFKGLDLMLEREVAIKMLRPELARQQQVVERFRAEAVTLAKLNHPNIATLYNFVRQGNNLFMVMEYVKGHTFENLIKQSGAMPYQRAVELFAQALDGIAHAHRLGVIHRDLKPANVMLMDGGLIKVMDFGIARVLGSNRLTRTGNVIGTIEYMSPEQIRGEETDARSDIYSAGILLYEMLTGRLPFESSSEYELMRRQIEDAPLPPSMFTKAIPVAVEQVIMRSLAKKPEARFQTADEFRAVLLKNLGEATARLVNTSVFAQGQQRESSAPPVKSQQAGQAAAKSKAAKKPVLTTLDFTSEPPASDVETPAQEAQQPAVKATRLADEDQSGSTAQTVKETRLAQEANADGATQQTREMQLPVPEPAQDLHALYQQAIVAQAAAEIQTAEAPPARPSPLATLIHRLTWKHYVTAMMVALLSIPVAFIASSGDPAPVNRNQSGKTQNVGPLPEQKSEPAAAQGVAPSVSPAPEFIPPIATVPADNVAQDDAPAIAPAKKARRRGSRPSSETGARAKKKDEQGAEKKDEKKGEKKGGLFDKVKGGLKKINPFKKGD